MFLSVLFLLFCFTILLLSYFGYRFLNPYSLVAWWNDVITPDRDYQNATDRLTERIPSLQEASQSRNQTIRALHALVKANHFQIVQEVEQAMKKYGGLPMIELDDTQAGCFPGQTGWKTIWVKFFNKMAPTADLLPTLKSIVKKVGNKIFLLQISILHPETNLRPHCGPSRGVLRYHYGLKIPVGTVGFTIEDEPCRWSEGLGWVWDDTLLHSAYNFTPEPRVIIFADVERELPFPKNLFNWMIYQVIQRSKHIKGIQERLKKEGIVIDG